MKRIFEVIGLCGLAIFSIYYSEQITTVIKNSDELLEEIKNVSEQYKIESIDALINGDTIIPGVTGSKINIDVSYEQMKKAGGIFNQNLLEYEDIQPKISVDGIYDKYIISGNKSLNSIALSFIVEENDNIDIILNVLQSNNIKVTFFITESWLEKNNSLVQFLIDNDHVVGIIPNNDIKWMDNIINNYLEQENGFCLVEEFDEVKLNECMKYNNYTIKPNLIIEKTPLIQFKNYLSNGEIVGFKITDELNQQFNNIIEFTRQKDYGLVTLNYLIEE